MGETKKLKALLALLREHGVRSFKSNEIEVHFNDEVPNKAQLVQLKDLSAPNQKSPEELEEELLYHSSAR